MSIQIDLEQLSLDDWFQLSNLTLLASEPCEPVPTFADESVPAFKAGTPITTDGVVFVVFALSPVRVDTVYLDVPLVLLLNVPCQVHHPTIQLEVAHTSHEVEAALG